MIEKLQDFQQQLTSLYKAISAETSATINKRALRKNAEIVSRLWIDEIEPALSDVTSLDKNKVELRTKAFRHLIKLSGPSNLKSSYLGQLNKVRRKFRVKPHGYGPLARKVSGTGGRMLRA